MKESFIVPFWERVLLFLEKISLFYFLRTFLPALKKKNGEDRFPKIKNFLTENYFIVDVWVIFNNILAVAFLFLAQAHIPLWVKYALLVYGGLRVFEIFIYQLNIIFVHPYRGEPQEYALESYRRMTIMLIHNFFEIIFWFAGTYILLQIMQDKTPSLAIIQSFLQMITYNVEVAGSKPTAIAVVVLQLQAVIGVFMTVLSLARFTSLFPKPNSKNKHEQEDNLSEKIDKVLKEIEDMKNN